MSGFQIIVDGYGYDSWTSAQVTASVKDASRSFSLDVVEADPLFWGLSPGSSCTVICDGGLLVTGYIDDFAPSFSASSHSISVSGRSKSADFIDCAAIYEKGGIKDKNILEIAKLLAKPFGTKIVSDEKYLKVIPKFQINQGDTCFASIEKLAKQQGLLLVGTADGGIDITKAKDKRHIGALIEGQNILDGNCTFSHASRFSEYIVKGQSKTDSKLKHSEIDKQIKRYRPTILMAESDMDKERCKTRGKWTKDRAAGEGTRANIKVAGMIDQVGKIFEPNFLIPVMSKTLKLHQDMLIESVTFNMNASGTIASLTLVDPRAYGGEAQKTSKSAGGFK